jgi:2-polyprenyl-6-methoxyphenol hydroxylase-like FAD-dependent oxidoreductase
MSAARLPVAIAGGGIAGLALALNLHARSIPCLVYEAASELKPLGVGITLLPHAMRELKALGLQDKIAAIGIETRESAFFNRFGQRIYGEPRGKLAGYPVAEYGIHRGGLHMLLYREVIARLGADAVVLNRRCVGLDQDAEGVTLHFQTETGEPAPNVRAEIAIACDGVNSAIRKQYYPQESLRYTGINTWRGVTRRKPILDGHTYIRIGALRTGKIVVYPIVDYPETGEQLINWVAELESDESTPNDWNRTAGPEKVLPIYKDWAIDWLDVPDLIASAEAIFEYPMVDKDPIDRWTFERVTFAGDAAHPMYPRGSNGSAQSFIDVRVLADLLAGTDDARGALAQYEKDRLATVNAIVQTNRTSPPDIINIRVEELTGDRPFDNLDAVISQGELRNLSDAYKRVAGFGIRDVA